MRQIAIFCFMWFGIIHAQAQHISITDKNTKEPIAKARLIRQTPKAYIIANEDGKADISNLRGAKKIEIFALGYKALVLSYDQIVADGNSIQMETVNYNLNKVVISANKWQQSQSEVPAQIESITTKEVTLQNPQTAADLLGISGKVYIQKSQQGGGSPMIRGFATNRLLYTVDGVRMNTAIFRGGNIQNVISLDPLAIQQTEVLFGANSVIYGSDAIGGVMSFRTLQPQLAFEDKPNIRGNALARFSTANNERTGHFDVNIGWKRWAMITSFSANQYDHLRQGQHGPTDYLKPFFVQRIDSIDRIISQDDPLLQIPSAYSQTNFMQKIRFVPNERWDIEYGLHFSETSPYGRYDRHTRLRNGIARYAEWNYGPQKWLMNNLSMTHQGHQTIYDQMSVRLAVQHFEESRIDRTLNRNDRNTQVEKVVAYSANADFIKSLGEQHTVNYGAEIVQNNVVSTGKITDIQTGIDIAGPARYPQSVWRAIGIHLNDKYTINQQFLIQAGVRYNRFLLDANFDTTFYPFPFTQAQLKNGALTGSLGAVYTPNEQTVIRANLGTAFRAPNVDDMGKVFDNEPGTVTVPNPNLQAEYAYNFDIGLAHIFDEVVKFDVSAYYTILQNALVRRNFTLNGQDSIVYDGDLSQVQAIQNAAVANVYGIQANIDIKFAQGFFFSTSLNFQQGKEELDNGVISASRHAAPFFGIAKLGYDKNKLQLQFYSQFQGKRSFEDLAVEEQAKDEIYAKDNNGNNFAPAWYTLNAKASYHFSDKMSVSSGIENITDQRYRPYSSGLSGAGRNFILLFNTRF